MIVGTAGHIDHGKSALVTALTGASMDRLAEERRRGITIDLGFAPLPLGDRVLGIVDVPGHEDFVRTMVAGASGIDAALLVVAADEGIMPQTEEHLAILEQLGVPAGIPVVTKADLAETEWVELVTAELAERLARSMIRFDAPLAVSARTGQGLDELRAALEAHARAAPPRAGDDLFRLPVDRAFSLAGVGTVVTGTAWSGCIEVGAPVALLPGPRNGRVRSIESFRRAVARSEPGARTAVGIAGIPREAARRGMVLVEQDGPWTSTTALDVEVALEATAPRPLNARARVRLHLGTAEVMARVSPRAPIAPGTRGLARLTLEEPVVARGQDRFVLRSYSPVTTIGGGRVLDPVPPRRRVAWPPALAGTMDERLPALAARRVSGIASAQLPVVLGATPREAVALASRTAGLRRAGDRWVSADALHQGAARALALLRTHHRAHPSERGMPLETLRRSLTADAAVVETVLTDLLRERRIRRLDGVVALAGFAPRVEGGDAEIDRIVRILEDAALSPPSLPELEQQTGRHDLGAVLRLAAATGRVEAVERDRYYARQALDRFVEVLTELGRGPAPIVPGAVRDRLGISRKFLIPLLEWADGKGVTVRTDDGRRLRRP